MFNKDQAREDYVQKHKDWNETKRGKPMDMTPEKLELLVELYPQGETRLIADVLGVSNSQLVVLIKKLRSSGLRLVKTPPEDKLALAIAELKRRRPDLLEK